MTAMSAAGTVVPVSFPAGGEAWACWLAERTDPGWRRGEWDPLAWLFTGDVGNAMTGVWKCAVRACGNSVGGPSKVCRSCHKALAACGRDRQDFLACHVPERGRRPPGAAMSLCAVARGGTRCGRPALYRGLCPSHHSTWYSHQQRPGGPAVPFGQWVTAVAVPYPGHPGCLVAGCGGLPMNDHRLCTFHWRQWSTGNRDKPAAHRPAARDWARDQTPFLGACGFSLAPLAPLARLEVLYGLQQRDILGQIIRPRSVRAVVRALAGRPSVRGQEEYLLRVLSVETNIVALARQLCWSLKLGFDEFCGVAPIDKDVLDLRAIGLKSTTRSGRRTNGGQADLTAISQPWLRELFRRWVDAERPHSHLFGWQLRAATIASRALAGRPGGAENPAALQFADMSAVTDGFRCASRRDGRPYTSKHRRSLLGRFASLLDFGRSAGLLDALPGSFARHGSHVIVVEVAREDEIGSAIPEQVISQLDAQLGSLGDRFPNYGAWAAADVKAMLTTVYIVLRDTGRRPGEIASLPAGCLEAAGGEFSLVWDNKKGRRNRRRLPLTARTAQAISAWQVRRARVPAPPRSTAYLFPAITEAAGVPHMDVKNISLAIRGWVASLPELHSDTPGDDGGLLPFSRSKIFPYAFRHSYAQRHADAGTPVDVLRELMDHKSVQTTMGYYAVSLKRKREAVRTLAAHSVDRSGDPAPFGSVLAYERSSVAVPFGGCTEPSNVKAGGNACPIRFQCAGCPFYRPDPSYLPAIEQQINDLRADRETAEAMNAASFVTSALAGQVRAYEDAAAKMRKRLADLPADERAEIEEASAVLRKARAAASTRALLPLTVIHADRQDDPERGR